MQKLLFFILIFTFPSLKSQTLQEFITVDQFGYRPDAQKIAIIKNPQVGFDDAETYIPGNTFQVVDANTDEVKFSGNISQWNNGQTDNSSGDAAWHFDFSSFNESGEYYLLDLNNNVKSYPFKIEKAVYKSVLKEAFRTFFYQRVGYEKALPFAEAGWTDGASHIGPLQDKNARYYKTPNDANSEKDVSGGWYDAGDYNKYTSWNANYIIQMLLAFEENPDVWTDDFNIPESNNGVPDIIDEALWGIYHLQRLQHNDGSMISVVSLDEGSPPSSASGPSLYGDINTSSALASAGAFAYASTVLSKLGMQVLADSLKINAEKAWDWADNNPNVIWRNNDAAYGSQGIAAGQQETNDYGRLSYKIRAAVFLFELTGEQKYHTYFLNNYQDINLFQWANTFIPFQYTNNKPLIYYTTIDNADAQAKTNIINAYNTAIQKAEFLEAYTNQTDPYLAHIKDYTWGSNNIRSKQALFFTDIVDYNTDASLNDEMMEVAENYLHYIHGRNPLSLVYLTNMNNKGASKSVNQIFHSWFSNGSTEWDEVGVSTYGPAPGFLAGGPNPTYSLDGCCPNNCGSVANNNKCVNLSPPLNQPNQKSFLDFNDSWPMNSWEITENSCGYQVSYISLLSKFVEENDVITSSHPANNVVNVKLYPNPNSNNFLIQSKTEILDVTINDSKGKTVYQANVNSNTASVNHNLAKGVYYVQVKLLEEKGVVKKLIIQ